MKKPKKVKEFYFKDLSHQDLLDQLNNKLPINIKHNHDLVDRVYERYPYISKTEISVIINAVFQSFRDLLVLGNILNFHNLFFDTKLFFFDRRQDGRILPAMKIKISTPPKLKE